MELPNTLEGNAGYANSLSVLTGMYAGGVVYAVVGDSEQPPSEIVLTETAHVANGPYPGLLEPVVGFAGLSRETRQEAKERLVVFGDQPFEGLRIASAILGQQLCIFVFHSCFFEIVGLHDNKRIRPCFYCTTDAGHPLLHVARGWGWG